MGNPQLKGTAIDRLPCHGSSIIFPHGSTSRLRKPWGLSSSSWGGTPQKWMGLMLCQGKNPEKNDNNFEIPPLHFYRGNPRSYIVHSSWSLSRKTRWAMDGDPNGRWSRYMQCSELEVSVSSWRGTPTVIIHFWLGFSRSQKPSSELGVAPWPWLHPQLGCVKVSVNLRRKFSPDAGWNNERNCHWNEYNFKICHLVWSWEFVEPIRTWPTKNLLWPICSMYGIFTYMTGWFLG